MKKLTRGITYGLGILSLLWGSFFAGSGFELPDWLYLKTGSLKTVDVPLPVTARAVNLGNGSITVNGTELKNGESTPISGTVTLSAVDAMNGEIELMVGESFVLKRIRLSAKDQNALYPGGQSIGVAIYTRGALVVSLGEFKDTSGVTICPGREAGLMPGDVILKANGKDVNSADHLSALIKDAKGSVPLRILRDGTERAVTIVPRRDATDGSYRLGLWVRDSTAGIGTMTYMDPSSKEFAALGHAITDVDLQQILQLREGAVIPAVIFDVIKGKSGTPGELCGAFLENEASVGVIEQNTDFGVYGDYHRVLNNAVYPQPLPIGSQDEIKLGKATILSTVDEDGVKEYSCEIIRVNKQKSPAAKGLVIKITDERLLSKTGGIVQGMSGSPIIQNGKIIGAVTHVFISDPTRGYGIFIENMLDMAG